uniref:Ig-like domain-containing protein n=2 Tax=Cyprinus carpio TaxID=7962 RepID=A0A8C1PT28_CYPCA
ESVFANAITALSSENNAFEGEKATLSCNYSGSNIKSWQWYRQYPNIAPEFLLQALEKPDLSRRLSAKATKDLKQVNLTISSAEETDSALYCCALQPTVTGNLRTLYKNLACNTSIC